VFGTPAVLEQPLTSLWGVDRTENKRMFRRVRREEKKGSHMENGRGVDFGRYMRRFKGDLIIQTRKRK